MTDPGPARLVLALIDTLSEEDAALERLGAQFAHQLDALRAREAERHDAAFDEAGDALGALGRLRAVRERQMRLLGRVLKLDDGVVSLRRLAGALEQEPATEALGARLLEARDQIHTRARTTRHRCDHLDFALRYVASLGHELMQALQGLDAPAPPALYTASGATRAATPRRLVNRVG